MHTYSIHTYSKIKHLLIHSIRLSVLTLLLACVGCDYSNTIETSEKLVITDAFFDSAPGFELPYTVFASNSIQDWVLTTETRLHYNKEKNVYIAEDISATKSSVDDSGPRFKICGENWSNQFGFSDHVPSEETTFGVTTAGTILSIQKVPFAASDMHMEFSQKEINASEHKKIRIEFKVIDNTDSPKALIRVSLY